MKRANSSTSSSRARSYSSRRTVDEIDNGSVQSQARLDDEPPMEPSLICMTVAEEGPHIAFACYNQDRNEIILEVSHASGYETESVVEAFVGTTRPNLVLVSNKVANNAALLQAITRPLPSIQREEYLERDNTNGAATAGTAGDEQIHDHPRRPSQAYILKSIPYRLLKSCAFDVRTCKALILQKLRVLSIMRRQNHYPAGLENHSEDRLSPLARHSSETLFQPSSYHSLAAILDFDSKVQIQALGGLLSFLQTTVFRLEDGGSVTINNIVHAHSNRYMKLTSTTFSALHIFATEHHPLVAKGPGNAKEGWSLFSLLDRTKSKGGRKLLRDWMLKPLLDTREIRARQNAVEIFMRPDMQTVFGILSHLLSKIGPIDSLLNRIKKCTTQPMDFLVLTRTLEAALKISESLATDVLDKLERRKNEDFSGDSHYVLLKRIFDCCNIQMLQDLHERITSIVDDEATKELKHSVIIRRGYHEELDARKDQYESLEGEFRLPRKDRLFGTSQNTIGVSWF